MYGARIELELSVGTRITAELAHPGEIPYITDMLIKGLCDLGAKVTRISVTEIKDISDKYERRLASEGIKDSECNSEA